jgi:hypothetical protein
MSTQTTFQPRKEIKVENLILVAILAYHLTQIIFNLISNGLFNNLGGDYLSFWSSGNIANTKGFSYVYDLNTQASVQQLYAPTGEKFGVVPTPFFPIFIVPFQLMALFSPGVSFSLWTLINLAVFLIYIKNRILKNLPDRYLWVTMLIIPVFQNIYYGQVEVWLMIFISEFLIASKNRKMFKSGIWLGLLMWKPQLLIFVIPFLFLKKSWGTLAGFFTTSLFVLISSLILIGVNGLIQIKNLWLDYSVGLPSNAPEVMMNWRMIGHHISEFISPLAGIITIILGSIFTLFLCLRLIIPHHLNNGFSSQVVPLFGIFSATLAVTWHSHIHMAMILIPFLFILIQQDALPVNLFKAWAFIPYLIYISVILILILNVWGVLPEINALGGIMIGTCMLTFNLLFLYKAYRLRNIDIGPESTTEIP